MEMGDYSLGDKIEQFTTQLEADGNEEIRFEAAFLVRLAKGLFCFKNM